nr:MAG TPA: hypothetical protein [Caudoviricetes sp.]
MHDQFKRNYLCIIEVILHGNMDQAYDVWNNWICVRII